MNIYNVYVVRKNNFHLCRRIRVEGGPSPSSIKIIDDYTGKPIQQVVSLLNLTISPDSVGMTGDMVVCEIVGSDIVRRKERVWVVSMNIREESP